MKSLLIFLDIDGVLNSYPFDDPEHPPTTENGAIGWSSINYGYFNDFVVWLNNNDIRTKIVIASGWGLRFEAMSEHDGEPAIQKYFDAAGLDVDILGKTPSNGGDGSRMEIPQMAADILNDEYITNYLVICDDYDSVSDPRHCFIKTTSTKGFNKESLEQAIHTIKMCLNK